MTVKILVYLSTPVYTALFTRGYNWFTTNFSVIDNLTDRKPTFPLWDMMVGVYYRMIYRIVRKQTRLKPLATRLPPATLLFLSYIVTIPYPPEQLSLKSSLHIIFAFVSTVLLLVSLALISWSQYPSTPRAYQPFLLGLAVIVMVSAVLLAIVGAVSNALEMFLTVTTVILSSRLVDCLRKLGGPDANNICVMK